jgi:hypothetical protein
LSFEKEVKMSDVVTVFETSDPALVPLVKSLLDSAGIGFAAKGDALQDILGLGRFPGGTNLLAGPVEFQVNSDDAEKARDLLSGLQKEGRETT